MNLKNLKFEEIEKDKIDNVCIDKLFGVLYQRKLFLGLSLTRILIKKFSNYFKEEKLKSSIKKSFNVSISIAQNVLKLDILKNAAPNSFEGSIFEAKIKNNQSLAPAWIGNTQMVLLIAKKLNLDMSDGKFYTSVDCKIIDNSIYLEFDKNNYKYSKLDKGENKMRKNKISWDRDDVESNEYLAINLISYVSYHIRNKYGNLKPLLKKLGFRFQKYYYEALAKIFNKNGNRSQGYPIDQIANSITIWVDHYKYYYTNGAHGMGNLGRDEEIIKKYINIFKEYDIDELIQQIETILKTKEVNIKL